MLLHAPKASSHVLALRQLECLKPEHPHYAEAAVVIGIPHKNQPALLRRALASALGQTLVHKKQAVIAVLDDQSHGDWLAEVGDIIAHPAITILSACCGSVARSRNQLIDWTATRPHARWVARLDADDEFAGPYSLEALYRETDQEGLVAVIGSNRLRVNGEVCSSVNTASPAELLNRERLTKLIEAFCIDGNGHELPSCNLLLRADTTLRYPNISSAEDHWLVMRLLYLFSEQVKVVPEPVYSIYTLNGATTRGNREAGSWGSSRKKLAFVARKLLSVLEERKRLYGYGLEGIVWKEGDFLYKAFYPWSLSPGEARYLDALLSGKSLPFLSVEWLKSDNEHCIYKTRHLCHSPVGKYIDQEALRAFLVSLYRSGIAALNIKRDNLRISPANELHYIDIGRDIQPLTSSRFLDMSARLYSIGVLGNEDEELVRRESSTRPEAALQAMKGFSEFYGELIAGLHPPHGINTPCSTEHTQYDDVTLLIKVCAQDADGLYEQICHIVYQLSSPASFASIVLLVDPHPGPFLRQYNDPDINRVMQQARQLEKDGVVDQIMVPDLSSGTVSRVYKAWFDTGNCHHTHTTGNAPLYPQIWAFSQISTRYVLQCDCDVLVGRKDQAHDYLRDMKDAISSQDVLCVGFNIPKLDNRFVSYQGDPGQFPPEVRFGLLDLERIKSCLPITNLVEDGRFQLTWHRALQHHQRASKTLRSVRGGDPRSFYVHPRNEDKPELRNGLIRDLLSQGLYPEEQAEQFDLSVTANWGYPRRSERVVVLLLGRLTPLAKLRRCLTSLEQQSDQSFGLVVIDDASGFRHSWRYPDELASFSDRYTLIRNTERSGHIANMLTAIKEICTEPGSMLVVLDQDDFLMQADAILQIAQASEEGHDLVQMPMFRPNKPLKLYQPDYQAPRSKGGGNTWSHLRAFRKSLFDSVPVDQFRSGNGDWFFEATDYATMLPMAELAKNPIFIDTGYAYWHERNKYSTERKHREESFRLEILAKPIPKGISPVEQ